MTIPDAFDIVKLVLAVVPAGIAVYGLRLWWYQTKKKVEYDLARRILVAAYQVRDEIQRFRYPIMTGSEANAARNELDIPAPPEGDRDRHYDDVAVSWEGRNRALTRERAKLTVELREAEAIWGRGWRQATSELDGCINDLLQSVRRRLRAMRPDSGYHPDPQADAAIDAVIFNQGTLESPDDFHKRVEQAVERIETRLRPHFATPSFWSPFQNGKG